MVSDVARLVTSMAMVSPPILPFWLAAVAAGRALHRVSLGSIANAENALAADERSGGGFDARLWSLAGTRTAALREAR